MIRVFERTGRGQEFFFFVSDYLRDSRNWNLSVESLRSSAVFEGRLHRSSPCLIRSAAGREQVWGVSETSEKWAKNCNLNGTLELLFSGS